MSISSSNTNPANTASIESFVVGSQALSSTTPSQAAPFVDRRLTGPSRTASERRQFGSSHSGLSEPGRELALAIDQYKLEHHRRYITCDEMLIVLQSLGYERYA